MVLKNANASADNNREGSAGTQAVCRGFFNRPESKGLSGNAPQAPQTMESMLWEDPVVINQEKGGQE